MNEKQEQENVVPFEEFMEELFEAASNPNSRAAYHFLGGVRGEDLDIYFEDEGIAIDVTPNLEHPRYQKFKEFDLPGYEVIMPVSEVENLIENLQTMVAKIRETFPDAA